MESPDPSLVGPAGDRRSAAKLSDAYLSDDREAQLRAIAPAACQGCSLYQVKDSLILGRKLESCGAVDLSAPNGRILSGVMLRLATAGSCPEFSRFPEV